jgi:hypothetical protein
LCKKYKALHNYTTIARFNGVKSNDTGIENILVWSQGPLELPADTGLLLKPWISSITVSTSKAETLCFGPRLATIGGANVGLGTDGM